MFIVGRAVHEASCRHRDDKDSGGWHEDGGADHEKEQRQALFIPNTQLDGMGRAKCWVSSEEGPGEQHWC